MSARLLRSGFLLPLLLVAPLSSALAQDLVCDPGDKEVRGVEFSGNRAFDDEALANAIATTASSWSRRVGLPFFGAKRCLDPLELERDVLRLHYFYRQRGYYEARVDTTITTVGEDAVSVRFTIGEGEPVIIRSLTIDGLDTLPDGEKLARRMREMNGRVYDRVLLQSMVDTIIEQLHDRGYAKAQHLLRRDSVDFANHSAIVEREFLPGRIHHIRNILITIVPADTGEDIAIDEGAVRGLLSVHRGDVYRERDLFRSQRDLYLLDAYRHVEVRVAPDSLQPPGDSLLDVQVRLQESEMRSVRGGIGWASLDCFRTSVRLTDRDFLGGARRLEVEGRLTKIALGNPLDFARSLCTGKSRQDQFSDKINYYTGVTFRQPTLFGPRNVPSLTLYSERRSEFQAYSRTTPFGGIFSVTREQRPRLPITAAYQIEYGGTRADEGVFCSVFNVCDLADIDRLKRQSRLAVVSLSIARDRTDNLFAPTHGDQIRVELRHASSAIGSDPTLEFNKALASASVFFPLGGDAVLALRAQWGGVFEPGSFEGASGFVPPQERLYAGGPSSVRGYNQNELGPVVYIVTKIDSNLVTLPQGGTQMVYSASADSGFRRASPTGGNTLLVGNTELRLRSPFLSRVLDWVGFMDVGYVYNRGSETFKFADLKWTPGMGIRVASPVGPLRLDVAYNGYPRRAGPAFFVDPLVEGSSEPRLLRCVSPGNTLDRGVGASCPSTFSPTRSRSFFSRLVFHFSIGQAF